MRAQGASEIIAFYLDEVLQYHRKPPLSSRLISNKQLYFYGNVPNKRPDSPYQKKDHKWVERTGVRGWISDVIERYLSPSYPVAVSMHAWARDMKTTAPAHGVLSSPADLPYTLSFLFLSVSLSRLASHVSRLSPLLSLLSSSLLIAVPCC